MNKKEFFRRDEQYAELIYGTYDPTSDRRVDMVLEGIKTYGDAVERGEFDGMEFEAMKSIEDALSLVPKDGKVLDVGAGTGAATMLLLPKLLQQNASIDAFDLMPELINELEGLATSTNEAAGRQVVDNFWTASFYNIQGPEGEDLTAMYDFAISNFALNYAEDLQRALQEISRVLKPGGHLLFSSVIIENPVRQYNKIHGIIGEADTGVEVMAYKYTEEDIIRIVESTGLAIVRQPGDKPMDTFSPPYYHPLSYEGEDVKTFVMICMKPK